MILLDTVAFCEPGKRQPDTAVIRWLDALDENDLFVSVVTIGEIEKGIAAVLTRDPLRARRPRRWLDETMADYEGRVLPLDLESAVIWGRDLHRRRETSPDLLIAATALRHGLTVATRNVRDFAPTGVAVVNPWLAGAGTV